MITMTDTQFCDTIRTLLSALGSNDPTQLQQARAKIRAALAANRRSWNDLMAMLHFGGKHDEKLKKLFAMLGQDNDGEFANARQKVSDLLAVEKRTWKAFVDALFSRLQTRGPRGTTMPRAVATTIRSTSYTISCGATSN